MDGDIVGTPAYMPPEQALGMIDKLSPRADVYSIGAMLYQLLVRQMPYVPPGARLSSRMVLTMVVQGPPPSIGSIRKDVPAELVAIVERAMAREPEQRYRDTLELADDLRAYLEHRVVKAYQTGALAELRKWVERNKALATSAAAAVLLLVVGLTTSLVFKTRSDRNAKLAEENASQAKANAEESARNAAVAKKNEDRATQNEQRALDGEALARQEKQRAEKRTDEVLRLSALQELDDLVAEADRLWPAHPESLPKYEAWLNRARKLLDELPVHEAKLAELRARALPWTKEEQAQQRANHPKLAELERANRHLEHRRQLRSALESPLPAKVPEPEEVGVDLAALPSTANEVNDLAWDLIDPDRKDWGGEAKGLVLARRAGELAAELSPAERAGIRDTIAWALFANGRFDEAVAEEEQALAEVGPHEKQEFQGLLERLKKKIEEEIDPDQEKEREKLVAELEQRSAELEDEISKRPGWLFAHAQDKWWHNQLEKLVSGLKAFSAPETGLDSSGTSPEHGWGIPRRAEFARTIADHSVSGTEVAARWAAAKVSIADVAECPRYGGLRIFPQLGLLPIGRDPDSGLWEFALLQTGEPAERGADGKLILAEQTGLVLVLLPGGTFPMGDQSADPGGKNYAPEATPNEGPVHEVTLSPFFLSKYEMTQGQWKSFVGSNPSYYAAGWSSAKTRITLMHPVEQVSWVTCEQQLGRLGLELPSEAQWEYACRAGSDTVWSTGDTLEGLRGFANIADEGSADAYQKGWTFEPGFVDGWDVTCPVGVLRPNAFGLHDVHGNVWEWCRDGYKSSFYGEGPKRDPVSDPGGSSLRVSRGGSFVYVASDARSAIRFSLSPSFAVGYLGARPARSITP